MNIGFEINNTVLKEGKISALLEAGLNSSWLSGAGTGNEVIFSGNDKVVYGYLLKYFRRHHKVPPPEIFRENFPSYPLKETTITLDELTDLASEKVNAYLVAEIISKTIDYHDQGQLSQAISLLKSESGRLGTDIRYRKARADNLSDPEFDIDAFLERHLEPGIPFGIKSIDDSFYGFQPGQLVTLMGRQKSGKTTFTLNSALEAWKEGYTVLFFSVEMDLDLLRQRLLCLGAHVSPSRMRRGQLKPSETERVKKFHSTLVTSYDEGSFFLSKKKSLITLDDIYAEAAQYDPNIIYIDGFNFMLDRRTNKTADDWQANESISAELKTLALEEGRVVFANTQVQEKQYHSKFGIEARTIASGTGLLKASDLVIGCNKEGQQHTVNCVMSRHEYFPDIVAEIDWDNMVIEEVVNDLDGVI